MAGLEKIEVVAQWDASGQPLPTRFTWQGAAFPIRSTGRNWTDEDGFHILCEIKSGEVFELIFLESRGWSLGRRPPAKHYI